MPREPDEFTSAWWRKQFRGLTHAFNLVNANYADTCDSVMKLEKATGEFPAEIERMKERIGELADKLDEVAERQDKMAEWLKEKFVNKTEDKP